MNFQTATGAVLISCGVILTCMVFGPSFIKSLEETGDRSSRYEVRQSALRSVPLRDRTRSNHEFVAKPQTQRRPEPLTSARQFSERHASTTPKLESKAPVHVARIANQASPNRVEPIFDNRVRKASGFESPERSMPIPVAQLPIEPPVRYEPRNIPTPAVPHVSEPPELGHSVLEFEEQAKSPLEQHYATPQQKFIKNRYVEWDAGPNERTRQAEWIGPRHADAPERVKFAAQYQGGMHREDTQEPTSVRPANFESRVVSPSMPLQTRNARRLGTRLKPEIDLREQRHEFSGQNSQPNPQMAVPMHQAALPRLRVNPQVEVRARERIEYGESLARRNSHLAAREEFTLALVLIARSHKHQSDPNAYSDRLVQGLTALDEAADFADSAHQRSQPGMLEQKVRSHKTRLIAAGDIRGISQVKALDYYCGYAQSQIEQAIGHSAAGSAALHALGKIESRSPVGNRRGGWTGQARALVFFRAAMSCNPANSVCSNDLGVLLHDMGRLKEAEQALKVSLVSSPTRMGWANLAEVHSQMASTAQLVEERDRQLRFARLAAQEAEKFTARNGMVSEQWTTMNEFQNNAAFPDSTMQPASEIQRQTANDGKVSTAKRLLQKVKRLY